MDYCVVEPTCSLLMCRSRYWFDYLTFFITIIPIIFGFLFDKCFHNWGIGNHQLLNPMLLIVFLLRCLWIKGGSFEIILLRETYNLSIIINVNYLLISVSHILLQSQLFHLIYFLTAFNISSTLQSTTSVWLLCTKISAGAGQRLHSSKKLASFQIIQPYIK